MEARCLARISRGRTGCSSASDSGTVPRRSTRVASGEQLWIGRPGLVPFPWITTHTSMHKGTEPLSPLSDDECWERPPARLSGGGGALPIWARAVAVHLPPGNIIVPEGELLAE
jgi:hypothetical protein